MDFKIEQLSCSPDSAGNNYATLIHFPAPKTVRGAILYIHGFVDYFFQKHVADAFLNAGYWFFALDLRKYGRSLAPGTRYPNYCSNISEYYEEISESLRRISTRTYAPITLFGHSTGGLIASMYAANGPYCDLVHSLILNSPFLEFNASRFTTGFLLPIASAIGRYLPHAIMPKGLSPLYGQSLHASERGEWEYNLEWKPIAGFPVYLGWVRAIHAAQMRLQKGLGIQIPVLLLHSDRSGSTTVWEDGTQRSDTVLNVDHMRAFGPAIGDQVTLVEIPDGMHDLFLSAPPVRAHALAVTLEWLNKETDRQLKGLPGEFAQ